MPFDGRYYFDPCTALGRRRLLIKALRKLPDDFAWDYRLPAISEHRQIIGGCALALAHKMFPEALGKRPYLWFLRQRYERLLAIPQSRFDEIFEGFYGKRSRADVTAADVAAALEKIEEGPVGRCPAALPAAAE